VLNAVSKLLPALVVGAATAAALAGAHAQVFIPPQPPMYQPQLSPYGYSQPQYQRTGSRCATPAGICVLPGVGLIGQGCYCNTPTGPFGGQIIP